MNRTRIAFFFLLLLLIGFWLLRLWVADESKLPVIAEAGAQSGTPASSSGSSAVTIKEKLRSVIGAGNAPIKFYGVVLDQNGVPLPGVKVQWDVNKSGAFAPSLGMPGGAKGVVESDAAGKFELDKSGSSLGIRELSKPGYNESPRMARSFGYGQNAAPHEPDPSNPERFIMHAEGSEPSVPLDVRLHFDWDGQPKEYEIGAGGISQKLILKPSRDPQEPGKRGYNWKLIVSICNGGLILAKMGDAPIAPDSGYKEKIVLEDKAGPRWTSMANELLFLKTESGSYAEVRLEAHSDYGMKSSRTGSLSIRWNLSGGRTFH